MGYLGYCFLDLKSFEFKSEVSGRVYKRSSYNRFKTANCITAFKSGYKVWEKQLITAYIYIIKKLKTWDAGSLGEGMPKTTPFLTIYIYAS
jgi:hypothetical protein